MVQLTSDKTRPDAIRFYRDLGIADARFQELETRLSSALGGPPQG